MTFDVKSIISARIGLLLFKFTLFWIRNQVVIRPHSFYMFYNKPSLPSIFQSTSAPLIRLAKWSLILKDHASSAYVMQQFLLLSKDEINTKKANVRAHKIFCTYLKEKNYGDGKYFFCHFPVIAANDE